MYQLQGHGDAMFLLGVMHENGDGVMQSETAAAEWCKGYPTKTREL